MVAGWPAFAGQLSGSDWSYLEEADVVLFGEVHDNPHHHVHQASAVAALEPAAIVFEHLTPELASRITPELIRNAARLESALAWEDRGWPDFAMYYPIFAAASDAAIFGGGVPPADARRAVEEGAESVFGGAAQIFQLERGYPVSVQAELERLQQEAHCNALPESSLPGMVEAQRLRDAALARATIAAHHESVSRGGIGPVVVITGNGHATKNWAVPYLLEISAPDLKVVSVGQFEVAAPVDPGFDYWLVTGAPDRADPCAAFK